MTNFSTFLIATVSIPYLWFALALSYPTPTHEEPIGYVQVVESEIEIEYVDTDIWNQWVFDTDSGIEYINFE